MELINWAQRKTCWHYTLKVAIVELRETSRAERNSKLTISQEKNDLMLERMLINSESIIKTLVQQVVLKEKWGTQISDFTQVADMIEIFLYEYAARRFSCMTPMKFVDVYLDHSSFVNSISFARFISAFLSTETFTEWCVFEEK